MPSVDRIIWNKLKVEPDEVPPYTGDRLASRQTLYEVFKEAGYKTGAEIGVEHGRNAEILCSTVPDVKLILVDPYKQYGESRDSQETHDKIMEGAIERLKPFNVEFWRMESLEAVSNVEDESLDFVYIDGAHRFDHVMTDIICWSRKVRKNGIIAGHDYLNHKVAHVKDAVDIFIRMHGIRNWYLIYKDDKYQFPSWFFVKRKWAR